MSRCIEEKPEQTTVYTLTAQNAKGASAQQAVTVQVGAPRVKIVSVDVDSVDSKAGESIHICVRARNATSFAVRPEQQLLSKDQRSCFADRPAQTTTYTVTATGAGGDTESEKITVKVSR